MSKPEIPSGDSSKKEIDQGPHRKPPRPPVIIYEEEPKTIIVEPEDFKALVQRLTGQAPGSSTSATDPHKIRKPPQPAAIMHEQDPNIIRVRRPGDFKSVVQRLTGQGSDFQENSGEGRRTPDHDDLGSMGGSLPRTEPLMPPAGILSQDPNSLPSIQENFFVLHGSAPYPTSFPPRLVSDDRNIMNSFSTIDPTHSTLFSPQINYMPSPDHTIGHSNPNLPPIPPNFFLPPPDNSDPLNFLPDNSPGIHGESINYYSDNTLNAINPTPSTSLLSQQMFNMDSSNALDHLNPYCLPSNFVPPLPYSDPLTFLPDHDGPGLHSGGINYSDSSLNIITPTPSSSLFSQEIVNLHPSNNLDHLNPYGLQPIPSNFFPPLPDSNPLTFLPDHGPGLHYLDNSLSTMNPTPSSSLFSQQIVNMHPSNTLDHLHPHGLQPIPSNFFPPLPDSNPLNFLPDHTLGLNSNSVNDLNNSLHTTVPTPSSTLSSPQINIPSPNTSDPVNTYLNFNRSE